MSEDTVKRKQVNVRLSEEDETNLDALVQRIKDRTGIPVRTVDVFRMALSALEKQYPAEPAAEPEPAKKAGKKGGAK